jgi:hypothetical protein
VNTAEFKVIEAMRQYGGDFVKSLAVTFVKADPVNQAKLKAAFPEIFERYAALVAIGEGQQ